MIEQLFISEKYTTFQLGMYYLGAVSWFTCYIFVLIKVFKQKFLEFPILSVSANVIWEFIWAFLFELDFGGSFLLSLWYGGFLMDSLFFYAVFKYGKIQVSTPLLLKYYTPIMIASWIFSGVLIYSYKVSGYDLPMGINSGMILNVFMSVMCLMVFLQLPDKKFSFWIGFLRFLGTDVFFFIYIVSVYPDLLFPIVMCVISFILDIIYLYLTVQRNRELSRTLST